jgi:hypothetical protein
MAKHPRVEPIRNRTLFEIDKLEQAGRLVNSLNVERPHSVPGLLLVTSAFTANGWAGAFYPPGMNYRLGRVDVLTTKVCYSVVSPKLANDMVRGVVRTRVVHDHALSLL